MVSVRLFGVFVLDYIIGHHYVSAEDWHFSGNNIALKKPTTQGPGTREGGGEASRAVDGDTNTDFAGGSCTHTTTNSTEISFWRVTLEKPYNVSGIRIYNRDSNQERLKNFTVFGKGQDGTNTMLYDDSRYKQYKQEVIKIEVNGHKAYVDVEIRLRKNQILTLCEVEIFAIKCKALERKPHAVVNPDKEYYEENATVQISCDSGYELTSDYNSVFCGQEGWNLSSPSCRPIQCDIPKIPVNGFFVFGNETTVNVELMKLPFDIEIKGKCNIGYKSNNVDISRKCQSNRTWSGEDIVCEVITCLLPGQISNGNYDWNTDSIMDSNKVKYGTVISVTCNQGYTLEGDATRNCSLTHTWTGTHPVCNIVTCDYPGDIPNGYYTVSSPDHALQTNYTNGKLNYSTEVQVNCTTGYHLPSGSSARKCTESGSWSEKEPICKLIMCEWPLDLKGGEYVPTNNATYEGLPLDTILNAVCYEEFGLSRDYEPLLCNSHGIWENTEAQCAPVPSRLQSKTAAIVGGSVGSVLVIVVVIVVLFLTRRLHGLGSVVMKRFKAPDVEGQSTTSFSNINTVRPVSDSEPKDHVYINTTFNEALPVEANIQPKQKTSKHQAAETYYNLPIPLTGVDVNFLSEFMLEDGAIEKCRKQFEDLPKGMAEKHSIALMPNNIGKNRYKNLYAYDASRVVLDTTDGADSDYINACYVDGPSQAKKYIASQGPTTGILVDFWRMVWQSKSNKIVMLTNLIEETKSKCEKYWPDTGCVMYGRIKVTLKSSEEYSDLVLRTLMVQKDTVKREIKQFHFTAWPDKGVPKYPSSLIWFLNKVNKTKPPPTGSIVVHCSAGIGRTGAYIALDYLREQATSYGYVDVAGTLKTLRKQRVNLVQTLAQYVFLYRCLAELFMSSTQTLSIAEFQQNYKQLLQEDSIHGESKVVVEFELLQRISRVIEDSEILTSVSDDVDESTVYANTCDVKTVFLPNFRNNNGFIVTQSPTEKSRSEFWNRVLHNNIRTIVEMKKDQSTNNVNDFIVGNIQVTVTNSDKTHVHCVKTISLRNKNEVRLIKLFEFAEWKTSNPVPNSPQAMLSLVQLVQSWQEQTGNNTIVVHCGDERDKCGLFCVVYDVIEQAKAEQEVAILHTIDDMRSSCKQIITSSDQHQFCHEVVFAFIQQNETYSNLF